MKRLFRTLLLAPLILTGCLGAQPFVRADNEGYEAGVSGKWKDVMSQLPPKRNKVNHHKL